MKKIKIKVSFRYDGEAVIDFYDDWKAALKDEEDLKQALLRHLNFEFGVDEDGTGAISDLKFEAEEAKE